MEIKSEIIHMLLLFSYYVYILQIARVENLGAWEVNQFGKSV